MDCKSSVNGHSSHHLVKLLRQLMISKQNRTFNQITLFHYLYIYTCNNNIETLPFFNLKCGFNPDAVFCSSLADSQGHRQEFLYLLLYPLLLEIE